MAMLPVENPPTPFMGKIPGGCRNGLMIRISGIMYPGTDRFDVNFMTGPNLHPVDDIALHMSIRPGEGAIVRNHYENQEWFTEERHGGCPVVQGVPFEIIVLATDACFKIAVNGNHFVDFRHRIPPEAVEFVHIIGDTNINYVRLEASPQYSCVPAYAGLY